jgi:pimeloyl-ACP methyl ester carboxylesterase
MAQHCRLVRFDQRGNGLSDWEPAEISADAMIADMNAVADAAGLERFVLFGISQGSAFAVRYAAENPDRVAGLILLGGSARGELMRGNPEQIALHQALNTLIREGWGSSNPVYRRLFTESMMPDASVKQKSSFDELQRVATSPQNATRIFEMNAATDVSDLARRIRVPTLVMHSGGDRRVPVTEGRRLAALIPGARFVGLPGNNHVLVGGSPALDLFLKEFAAFLRPFG